MQRIKDKNHCHHYCPYLDCEYLRVSFASAWVPVPEARGRWWGQWWVKIPAVDLAQVAHAFLRTLGRHWGEPRGKGQEHWGSWTAPPDCCYHHPDTYITRLYFLFLLNTQKDKHAYIQTCMSKCTHTFFPVQHNHSCHYYCTRFNHIIIIIHALLHNTPFLWQVHVFFKYKLHLYSQGGSWWSHVGKVYIFSMLWAYVMTCDNLYN